LTTEPPDRDSPQHQKTEEKRYTYQKSFLGKKKENKAGNIRKLGPAGPVRPLNTTIDLRGAEEMAAYAGPN